MASGPMPAYPAFPRSCPFGAWPCPGLLTSLTDALGNTSAFEYDVYGNLTRTTDPLGHQTVYAYDAVGNLLSLIDAEGRTTRFTYDALNRLLAMVDPAGSTASYTYDPNGNLTSITDENGNTTTIQYDARNRPVRKINALGAVRTFGYEDNGQLMERVDENGQSITYVYDAANQLVAKNLPNDSVEYTYDDAGNVLTARDGDSALAFAYDALNRVVSASTAGSPSQPEVGVGYAFDARGNRARMSGPAGDTVYTYDALDRLVEMAGPGGERYAFAYDAASRRVGMSLPNGIVSDYGYDPAGRLISLGYTLPGGTVPTWRFDYGYDGVGNRVALDQQVPMAGAAADVDYVYDELDRLVAATAPVTGEADSAFSYDAAGNRLRQTGQAEDAVFDAANRLLQDADFDYAYDANGNRVRRSDRDTGEVIEYAYDAENRLVSVIRRAAPGGAPQGVASYRYDAFGRRIRKEVDGDVVQWVYDHQHVLAEYRGAQRRDFAYYNYQPLGFDEGASYSVLTDALGTPRSVTDADGTEVWAAVFRAFGSVAALQDTGVSYNLRLPGQYYDAESELHYNLYRDYDPLRGRYLQPDPLGLKDGLNHYIYVKNNPVILIDPTGEIACGGWCIAGLIVGGVAIVNWSRNLFNEDVSYTEANKHWTKLTPKESVFHRMGPGNENNIKFVSPSGHSEAVFKPNGCLVTDPANVGTFNFFGPRTLWGVPHGVFDVIPYYAFGNTPTDMFNLDRFRVTYDLIVGE
jgi:RHS repeat-associated protein